MKLITEDIFNSRIFIVDDQQVNVSLLAQLLNEAGYNNIRTTTNSCEVCELHRKYAFDLILLDLQMPNMDGFQVMEALKANTIDDYLPVIVLTAQPDQKLPALQAGAKDFICKPFDFAEIKTRIFNMLEVRLLYKKIASYNKDLEETVAQRTAELCESEARFRRLTELASDWYWEQDEHANFTKVSGPVLEMLGIQVGTLLDDAPKNIIDDSGWNKTERQLLQALIAARQPFIDFLFSRINLDGSSRRYRVSGEPMFNGSGKFIGYRGIGIESTAK